METKAASGGPLGDGFRQAEVRVSVQVWGACMCVCAHVWVCAHVLGVHVWGYGVCAHVGCVYRCLQSGCVLLGVCDCVLFV